MKRYELNSRYSSAKSFYGKAHVEENLVKDKATITLISYSTEVAKIIMYLEPNTRYVYKKEYIYLGHYSSTTTRHQKEFFMQNGLGEKEIKQLIKDGKLIKEGGC